MIRQYELTYTIQWHHDLVINKPLSSVLRGAMGLTLRQSHCSAHLDDDCLICHHHQTCVYAQLVNPVVRVKGKLVRGVGEITYPFEHRTCFYKGEVYNLRLLVFEGATDYLLEVKEAIQTLASMGLGNQRITFDVLSFSFAEVDWPETPIPKSGIYMLTLKTPTRLFKQKQLLVDDLTVHDIFKFALQRYDHLLKEKLHLKNTFHFDEMHAQVHQLNQEYVSVNRYQLDRHSTRTKQSFEVDGTLGYVIFSGDMTPQLLELCGVMKYYGIGKNTVVGYGVIDIVCVEGHDE